jgi:hypothetical protein
MLNHWSRFSEEFDDKQEYAAGREVIWLVIEKLGKLKDIGDVLEFGRGNGRYTRSIVERARSVFPLQEDIRGISREHDPIYRGYSK